MHEHVAESEREWAVQIRLRFAMSLVSRTARALRIDDAAYAAMVAHILAHPARRYSHGQFVEPISGGSIMTFARFLDVLHMQAKLHRGSEALVYATLATQTFSGIVVFRADRASRICHAEVVPTPCPQVVRRLCARLQIALMRGTGRGSTWRASIVLGRLCRAITETLILLSYRCKGWQSRRRFVE